MKMFAEFVLAMIGTGEDKQYESFAQQVTNDIVPTVSDGTVGEKSVMRIMLGGRTVSQGLDSDGCKRMRHFLIEFAVGNVSKRRRTEFGPATMLGYLRGVQRRLEELGISVNLFQGPVFNELNLGLVTAINNLFAKQQAEGTVTKSHNVLTISDIQTIFSSEFSNPRNAEGYRNRLVFAVGIGLDIRTSELHGLKVTELKQEDVDGSRAYVYYPPVGTVDGKSKNRPGGIKAIKKRAR